MQNLATKLRQATSLETATHAGEPWTSADLEFLAACPEIPAPEVAQALGRSLYAVYVARGNLADRVAHRNHNKPLKRAPERTWTFIGTDVPEGW